MSKNKISRKDFLSYSALLGVTSMVGSSTLLSSCGGAKGPVYTPLKQAGEYYIPELPDKAIDGKELKAGVIGCGGRGSGAIVDLLTAANGIKVTALGDTFADRLEGLRKNLKEQHNQDVPAENCFIGFDAYKKVIDSIWLSSQRLPYSVPYTSSTLRRRVFTRSSRSLLRLIPRATV